MKAVFLCILTILNIYVILGDFSMKSLNKGAVKINLKDLEFCRGPKKNNITVINKWWLSNNGISPVNDTVKVNTSVSRDSGPLQAYLQFYPWNPLRKKYDVGFKLRVNNVCHCILCKDMISKYYTFKEPFEKCIVLKGTYYQTINVTKLSLLWFRNNIFVGKYKFRFAAFTPLGNLGCGTTEAEITKF